MGKPRFCGFFFNGLHQIFTNAAKMTETINEHSTPFFSTNTAIVGMVMTNESNKVRGRYGFISSVHCLSRNE